MPHYCQARVSIMSALCLKDLVQEQNLHGL
jgi:hypothetical protein